MNFPDRAASEVWCCKCLSLSPSQMCCFCAPACSVPICVLLTGEPKCTTSAGTVIWVMAAFYLELHSLCFRPLLLKKLKTRVPHSAHGLRNTSKFEVTPLPWHLFLLLHVLLLFQPTRTFTIIPVNYTWLHYLVLPPPCKTLCKKDSF